MKYILDTNVVSELKKRKPHGGVKAWINAHPLEDLAMAAVVGAEIQAGIEKTRVQDPEKAADIENWFALICRQIGSAPADLDTCREQARLMDKRKTLQPEDALVAATAVVRQAVIVTRNVKDFAGLGIPVVNPFDYR